MILYETNIFMDLIWKQEQKFPRLNFCVGFDYAKSLKFEFILDTKSTRELLEFWSGYSNHILKLFPLLEMDI